MALRQTLTLARQSMNLRVLSVVPARCMSEAGSGKGKGGGSGGTIRDAGGAFGKREAAFEEQYFRKKQAEQLAALKESVSDEIKHHKEQIEEHKEAIERHKKKMGKLNKMAEDD